LVSADGTPFVHHNYVIRGLGYAFEHDWGTIKHAQTDARSFKEVLKEASAVGTGLIVDTKTAFQDASAVHDRVIEAVRQAKAVDATVLVDWDWPAVAESRARHSDIRFGAAVRGRVPKLAELLDATRIQYLYLDWDLLRPSDVETCHAADVAVATTEGWESRFYKAATDLQVDFVLSDDAAACRRAFAANSGAAVQ
jgi:hypothetical protein